MRNYMSEKLKHFTIVFVFLFYFKRATAAIIYTVLFQLFGHY